MATITVGKNPGGRLQGGAAVLAAAKVVDLRPVKARFTAFQRAHAMYVQAQGKVDAAEEQLRAAQARLGERDAVQDEAVEVLARALVAEGQPRANPFAALGAPAPKALQRQPTIDEAKVIHRLVAAVQRNKGVSKATLQAAQAVEKAALAVEQAAAPIAKLQAAAREARHTREAIAQTWETALAALKRGARAASDDGAPQLYATLFERPSRSSGKAAKPAPSTPPGPTTQPAATAAS
jgi:hypothetical protein